MKATAWCVRVTECLSGSDMNQGVEVLFDEKAAQDRCKELNTAVMGLPEIYDDSNIKHSINTSREEWDAYTTELGRIQKAFGSDVSKALAPHGVKLEGMISCPRFFVERIPSERITPVDDGAERNAAEFLAFSQDARDTARGQGVLVPTDQQCDAIADAIHRDVWEAKAKIVESYYKLYRVAIRKALGVTYNPRELATAAFKEWAQGAPVHETVDLYEEIYDRLEQGNKP